MGQQDGVQLTDIEVQLAEARKRPGAGVYQKAGFVFDQDQIARGRTPRRSRASGPKEDHSKVRLQKFLKRQRKLYRDFSANMIPSFSALPSMQFYIWENGRPRSFFYTSDDEEVSMTDKMEICKLLKTSHESVSFSVSHFAIDPRQLPQNPTFTNEEGREYWIFV